MILARIWCRLVGHKWRRLRKGEHLKTLIYTDAGRKNARTCRCGAERIAKSRKPKQETVK